MLLHKQLDKQQRRRRIIFRIKIYLFSAAFLIILIAGWYFIANASIFKIKFFEVNGLDIFSKEEFLSNIKPLVLRGYFSNALGFDNIWAWPNKITYNHPALKQVRLDKDFWKRTITFDIEERLRYGIWCAKNGTNCSWFDKDGGGFGDAPTTDGFLVLKISGEKPESEMSNILKILDALKKRNVAATDISFDKELQELSVKTLEGAKIIFSTRFNPISIFISAYEGIVKKIGFKSIKYLDLTVENRIYYQ
ncbi:MAG: hypothetical protein AAB454_01105 [Patescibacteria group bacterium]